MQRKKVCTRPENLFQPAQGGRITFRCGLSDLRTEVAAPPCGSRTTDKAVPVNRSLSENDISFVYQRLTSICRLPIWGHAVRLPSGCSAFLLHPEYG